MISFIRGTIIHKSQTSLILENNGIGYKIFTIPKCLEHPLGTQIALYTYQKVSDDGITLFGLPDQKSLDFFELLISVSGVGPKMALTIISAGTIDTLERAIATADAATFTRMSGVGNKTAERIILELKTKISSLDTAHRGNTDTFDALIALGYSAKEVREVINQLDAAASGTEQLKQALKLLSSTT